MNTRERVENAYKFFKSFGINQQTVRFFMKRKWAKDNETIKFSTKKLIFPICLRGISSDFCIFDQIFLDKSYEINFQNTPKVVLDCGANIGFATVYFKNRFPDAKIICIEPDLSNFEILQKNTEKYDNITLYNMGLWNKKTDLIIENPSSEKFGFVVKEAPTNCDQSIKAISIKDIMEEQKIDFIDVLKIDIEGSEKEVFTSDYEYWLPRTRYIIIELHDHIRKGSSKAFFEALVRYNFSTTVKGENIICSLSTD